MLVYGDQVRVVEPRGALQALQDDLERVWRRRPGRERHDALTTAFVRAGELAAALADADFGERGADEVSGRQDAGMDLLTDLARALDRSWRSGFADLGERPSAGPVIAADMPTAVKLKLAEGFAFYAVYPEAYLEAARGLAEPPVVIGLRGIGAALAALVAAASGGARPFTLRPAGPPFDRCPIIGPKLEAAILARPNALFAIADEGPGLSGSSFGGVADWLEARGVARERIVFLPSHPGDPGPEARPDHLARWRAAERRVRTFDDLFLAAGAPEPIGAIFEDLTGPLAQAPEDVSGALRAVRLSGAAGRFVARFAGLDAGAKFDRARALHAGGFTPKVLALRRGLMLERDVGGEADAPTVGRLADYLAFRARRLPAERVGASLGELLEMSRTNVAEGLGPDAANRLLGRWRAADVERLGAEVRPVHVDARLHRRNWRRGPSGSAKLDALDGSEAHDLVGPQDVAWDVAGAVIELELGPSEVERLQRLVEEQTPLNRELVDLLTPCYLAFQLGLATFAGSPDRERYRAALAALASA